MKNERYITIYSVLLAVIPTLLLSLIISVIHTSSVYKQNMQQLQLTSDAVSNYLSEIYQNSIDGLEDEIKVPAYIALLQNPTDSTLYTQAEETIMTLTLSNSQIESSFLTDLNGKIVCASDDTAIGGSIKGTATYRDLVDNDQDSTVRIRLDDNQPMMRVSVRVYDSQNQFIGILSRNLSLPMVKSLALQANELGSSMILIGSYGETLEYIPDDENYYGYLDETANIQNDERFQDLIVKTQSDESISQNDYIQYKSNNINFLGAYAIVPVLEWIIVTSEPKAMLMYTINQYQIITLILTLVLALGAGFMARNLSEQIEKSFHHLGFILDKYKHDDYEDQCSSSSVPMINQLGTAVNEIGKSLRDKDQEIANLKRQLRDANNLDERTKLSSRSAIYTKIAQLFGHNENQALVLINIDAYKELVNLYGSQFGYSILDEVAQLIRPLKSENLHVARLNDDDFLLFFSNYDEEEDVLEVIFQLLNSIQEINVVEGQQINLSASAGIVYMDDNITSRTVWMEKVDQANYSARKTPKHIFIYDDETEDEEAESSNSTLSKTPKDDETILNDFLFDSSEDFFISGDSRGE